MQLCPLGILSLLGRGVASSVAPMAALLVALGGADLKQNSTPYYTGKYQRENNPAA